MDKSGDVIFRINTSHIQFYVNLIVYFYPDPPTSRRLYIFVEFNRIIFVNKFVYRDGLFR